MLRRSLLLTLLLASPLLGQAANSLPTVDQLKAQLDSNPQEVLRGVSRLLALKGAAAQQYDRYELFSLRGEASLRSKAMPAAAEAFAAAAKETTDADKKAIARANEILIRKSKNTGYAPKPPRPGAAPSTRPFMALIPIIKPDDRKMAIEALLNDEMTAAAPKIKAADNAQALPPIIEAAKLLGDLNALETTAYGKADQSKQIAENVGKRAHFMIDNALKTMSKRTEDCWASASRKQYTTDNYGNRDYQPGMLGLTSNEANTLKEVIATTEKVVPVATDLATVTGSAELGTDATTAQKLHERAREVLDFDYPNSGRYTKQRTVREQLLPPQQPQTPTQQPRQTTPNPPRQ
jgi:hypothetical protein